MSSSILGAKETVVNKPGEHSCLLNELQKYKLQHVSVMDKISRKGDWDCGVRFIFERSGEWSLKGDMCIQTGMEKGRGVSQPASQLFQALGTRAAALSGSMCGQREASFRCCLLSSITHFSPLKVLSDALDESREQACNPKCCKQPSGTMTLQKRFQRLPIAGHFTLPLLLPFLPH